MSRDGAHISATSSRPEWGRTEQSLTEIQACCYGRGREACDRNCHLLQESPWPETLKQGSLLPSEKPAIPKFSREGFCRNPRGIFRTNFNFASWGGDCFCRVFWGLFPWRKHEHKIHPKIHSKCWTRISESRSRNPHCKDLPFKTYLPLKLFWLVVTSDPGIRKPIPLTRNDY